MTDKNRQEMFLSRAKDAEEQAAKAQDAISRDQWLKIAAAYRELARTA
jgi:uncharacterized alpha-E superfamily protein